MFVLCRAMLVVFQRAVKDQTCPDSLHVSVAEVLRCCGLRVSPRWRQTIDAILDACRALRLSWSFVSSRHGWGGEEGERGRCGGEGWRDHIMMTLGHGKTPSRRLAAVSYFHIHAPLYHLVVGLLPDLLTRPKTATVSVFIAFEATRTAGPTCFFVYDLRCFRHFTCTPTAYTYLNSAVHAHYPPTPTRWTYRRPGNQYGLGRPSATGYRPA